MMKRLRTLLQVGVVGLLSLVLVGTLYAQERGNDKPRVSPNASVGQTFGTTKITITYGRPSVKGRQIFGGLQEFGKVWRTGANESTNITFSNDVKIEGKPLKAGTYSLYTIPGKDEWTIIINSKLSWGTQYDAGKDVLRVTVKPKEGQPMEQLLISFEEVTDTSAKMIIHWEKTIVPVTIQS